MSPLFLLMALGALPAALSTAVNQCKPKSGVQDDTKVNISVCEEAPCTLRRKNNVVVSITFTPKKQVDSLRTQVFAEIGGIPFPFIGVDGKSVCSKLYLEDGKTKASCPLQVGTTYLYRDSFDVLQVYPKLKVNVHWALKEGKTKQDITCFEIPAKIV